MKQALKITLLIIILAEGIKSVISKLKIEKCNICSEKKISYRLLHDDNLTICSNCASHFNEMSNGD